MKPEMKINRLGGSGRPFAVTLAIGSLNAEIGYFPGQLFVLFELTLLEHAGNDAWVIFGLSLAKFGFAVFLD